MRYTISKWFTFEAAHHLPSLPEDHQCHRMHGHTYNVDLTVGSDRLDEFGFVVDFAALMPLRRHIEDVLDHRVLNEVLPFEPTCELVAQHLGDWASEHLDLPAGVAVVSVRVAETPSTAAEYRPMP